MTGYPFARMKWKKRSAIMAQAIPDGASVIDLGGGEENLRTYLRGGAYTSIDKYPCTAGTVLADFNAGQFPDLEPADVVVAQGLFEYIEKPEAVLQQIHKYGPVLITSYRSLVGKPAEKRTPALDLLTFELLLIGTGWEITSWKDLSAVHRIYFCKTTV